MAREKNALALAPPPPKRIVVESRADNSIYHGFCAPFIGSGDFGQGDHSLAATSLAIDKPTRNGDVKLIRLQST